MIINNRSAWLAITFFLLSGFSWCAHAGIHKCVAPDGSATYTDQPCPSAKAEDKVDPAVSGAGRQLEIADTCNRLNTRKLHCGRVYSLLETNFKQYCANPLINYQMDHQHPQQNNRYRSGRERQADVVSAAQEQIAEDYHCESVEHDTWAFLKSNFSKKISEKDSNEIEYNVQAVPGGNRPTNSFTRPASNSGPRVTTTVTTSVHTVISN
ncbi:hypothetical protein AAKU67_002505 [Oxalobacteraceae bacterium GrIS 2.11]